MRIALGFFKSSPIVSLQAESGLKLLEMYRDVKMINYRLRIKANEYQTIFNELTKGNYEQLTYNTRIQKPLIYRVHFLLKKYNLRIDAVSKSLLGYVKRGNGVQC